MIDFLSDWKTALVGVIPLGRKRVRTTLARSRSGGVELMFEVRDLDKRVVDVSSEER
ncbi:MULTISPECIES: hypothetical protein [Natrialbaceae]|uniref:hypothetical protein n=1 Tax=Natrialbaceae TaxID=1644061 RepID=UPI00207C1300|nr:hypothetical protein [Natronococcus sp. CG52]